MNLSDPGTLNCVGRSASSRSSFSFFQGIRDHIRPVSKAVKKAVALTAKPGIGAEDKLAAVKIPDHFRLQRLQGKLFVLVSGIQVKGKRDAVCIHEKPHGHDGIGSVFLAFAILFMPSSASISK